MIRVFPLNDLYESAFADMFAAYYAELGCEDDALHLVKEYVLPDLLAGLLKIDLIEDGSPCGFCIYQIDRPGNEWNFRDGCGDIREIYILPEHRGKGLGRFLLFTAEMRLKEAGAAEVYALPDGEACDFFAACGYELTDDVCAELDCNVYEKKPGVGCGNCKNGNNG